MNLTHLRSLVAVVDTANFTDAAEHVHLTQSAVSHAPAALERELGIRLVERNRRGSIALTSVGHQIMLHVRALLAQAEAIEQVVTVAHGKPSGKVRLGSIVSFIPPELLTNLLTWFSQRYPKIEVVVFEGAMHEVGGWLEHSVIDVGFVILPVPDMTSTVITTDELCVLVPSDHRLSMQQAVTSSDIQAEVFITEKTHCALYLMKRAGLKVSTTQPAIRYQASDRATIVAMVREGLGITLVPRRLLPKQLDGTVALRLDPPQPFQLGLASKPREVASLSTTLFMQSAVEWVQAHPA